MKVLLLIAYLIVCAVIMALPPIVAEFPDYANFSIMDAGQAVLVCLIFAGIAGYFIYQDKEGRRFPAATLCVGLLIRMLVATGIFMFNMQEFFGGDAITYDFFGDAQMRAWQGDSFTKSSLIDL